MENVGFCRKEIEQKKDESDAITHWFILLFYILFFFGGTAAAGAGNPIRFMRKLSFFCHRILIFFFYDGVRERKGEKTA